MIYLGNNMYASSNNDYLMHYGRKGMKWGQHIFGTDVGSRAHRKSAKKLNKRHQSLLGDLVMVQSGYLSRKALDRKKARVVAERDAFYKLSENEEKACRESGDLETANKIRSSRLATQMKMNAEISIPGMIAGFKSMKDKKLSKKLSYRTFKDNDTGLLLVGSLVYDGTPIGNTANGTLEFMPQNDGGVTPTIINPKTGLKSHLDFRIYDNGDVKNTKKSYLKSVKH